MTRQDRRRAHTRAKLVAATKRVIADKGVDGATIAHITDQADVGFGSFYNHFAAKDDAIEAAVAEVVEDLGAALDALTAPMDDPAEVVAVALRHVVDRVEVDPVWAWFVVRAGVADRLLGAILGGRFLRDLESGVDAGRFDPALHPVTPFAVGGIVQAVMRAELDGVAGDDAPAAVAEMVLRLLGVDDAPAREIARRPLPPLPELAHA